MILYFTGTGNSYQLAKAIADVTGDEVVSLNDRMKAHRTDALHSEKPFVFVTPIYCGRIPRVVEDHIRATEFTGTHEAYFAATCFQTPYKARRYLQKLCTDKGWKFNGIGAVPMPQNYIVMYTPPAPAEAKTVIEAAEPKMRAIAQAIRDGKPLEDGMSGGAMMSDIINPIFYKATINAKGFTATEACIGCGTCAAACPLDNIHLKDGRPIWGDACTHCMSCIDGCPKGAIEFKGKTAGKPRYWNPCYTLPTATRA